MGLLYTKIYTLQTNICTLYILSSFGEVLVQGGRGSSSDIPARAYGTAVLGQFFVQDFDFHDLGTVPAIVSQSATLRVKMFTLLAEAGNVYEIVVGGSHAASKIYPGLYENP